MPVPHLLKPLPYFQPLIPNLDIEQRNFDLNHLRAEDRSAHNWYRFILSFPPHLVRQYLEKFAVTPQHTVLDPFCGTGTTAVECKKTGIPTVGIEANRMAWFAGSVKLDWTPDPERLLQHAEKIGAIARATIDETQSGKASLGGSHPHAKAPRTLPEESQKLLLKNSISPLPLHKTLILLDQLRQHSPSPFFAHEQLALAKAIVFSISNIRFAPEVSIGKAKADAPVVEVWLDAVRAMATDLDHLRSRPAIAATMHHADSRQLLSVLDPASIDAVITSPPYPNEKDYTRTTRLESVLLGFLNNKSDLQTLKRGLMRSNSRNVYTTDDDDQWVVHHGEIQRIAAEIDARRLELGKTSGFERVYAQATKLYFGGMAKHLADLRYALRPGAKLAYVVGDQASYLRVMIRTGRLIAGIAEALGYEVEAIDLFRTRLATATKEQLREEVVVLRWSGKFPVRYPFSDKPL
ncbi:DNA methyltransferase [Myxacorys almedinensis]|uniref:site-specific DNA-methyltransferase (cytosine-N(4)-specific) n=1 Tax=Myxacorys almedinensis A TaxID=2690445 RepID=A0A8J8CIU5_9CYAN|nr:DNA methyltransferase [Myxacorys almedinensis]NDJ18303.1 DNA methyltransferase [Myxacorys almedinensis A]